MTALSDEELPAALATFLGPKGWKRGEVAAIYRRDWLKVWRDAARRGAALDDVCAALLPGVRINPFGQLGTATFTTIFRRHLARRISERVPTQSGWRWPNSHRGWEEVSRPNTGSGSQKSRITDALRPANERGLMWSIKAALDLDDLLNPGVVMGCLPDNFAPRFKT